MRHAGSGLVWMALLVGRPPLDRHCDGRPEVGVVIAEHHAGGGACPPDRQWVAIMGEQPGVARCPSADDATP